MSEPRVPDNDKGWNDIDIFLFSNGQQYSPPRKYHLQSDELEFWEATILYMARTQYGSMHSNIELYTLDGKKIDSPLELIDASSYVAVKPPDAFIPAGYERYLIKASRSWEKRQEKLTNIADMTGESKMIEEYSKSAVDEFKDIETTIAQSPQGVMAKDLDSIGTNNTIVARLIKENDRSFDHKSRKPPFLSRKSVDNLKNKSLKKDSPQISKNNAKDDLIISKKRNISVPKNYKSIAIRRESISAKNKKNNTKIKIDNNRKEKIQPNITKSPEVKKIIVLSKPSSANQPQEKSNLDFDKGLPISSDVYKNPESEVQSVYIDADQKIIARDKDKNKHNELHKIVELDDELVESIKSHKATSIQSLTCCNDKHKPEINTSFVSKAKVFNIKLNIDVRDYRDPIATNKSGNLNKCKSNIALLTAEQESQANFDIYLNDANFKNEDSLSKRKLFFTDRAFLKTDVDDSKVILMNCSCGLLQTNNLTNKSNDNYILLIPSTFAEKNVERCNPDNNQPAEKDSFKSHHPIKNTELPNPSNPASKGNSQTIIKHKVSICPDRPIKISAEIPSKLKTDIINVVSSTVPVKVDQFTQTEWCNVLLQARPQANGHFLFHLPPLHVLAQYNLL